VGALPFLLGAFLSPLAGLGGDGAATVAGILLAALCVTGLPCVLLIAGRRRKVAPSSSAGRRPSQKLTCRKCLLPVTCGYPAGRMCHHEC
jgi:hypothetical protein